MSQPILTFTVNQKEFDRAAADLFRKSTRTYPEFVNGQLYGLAIKAMQFTEKASKAKIRAELGSGKDSFAARIINSRLKAAGKPMIWGPVLNAAAARLVAARTQATGFVKSGWLWAIRAIAPFVKNARGRIDRSVRARGAPKGSARIARPAISAVVSGSITNTALREPEVVTIAERGLIQALAYQAADMTKELQRRIQKDIDSVK